MSNVRVAFVVLAVAAGAALIAACGGGDGYGGSSTATRAPATTPGAGGGANSGGSGVTLNVTAKDFSFDPAKLEATKGAPVTVALKNEGAATHTLTLYKDDGYTQKVEGADTGQITGGASGGFTATFASAGDFYFRCELHPTQMQGEIEVK